MKRESALAQQRPYPAALYHSGQRKKNIGGVLGGDSGCPLTSVADEINEADLRLARCVTGGLRNRCLA
uniref:Uncharacterized protein n=1 Tax=Sphaerodactylus townsendi TaxID=933632 RepID=A0ACB8EX58_9SAUR